MCQKRFGEKEFHCTKFPYHQHYINLLCSTVFSKCIANAEQQWSTAHWFQRQPFFVIAAAELGATAMEAHSCVKSGSVKQYVSLCSETFIISSNTLLCLSVHSLFRQEEPSPENSRLLRACRRVWYQWLRIAYGTGN